MTIAVRALSPEDAIAADRVYRLAFGTMFGLKDPMSFRGDAALLAPRLASYPKGGLVAVEGGEVVGMCFLSRWGSLGILGPIAVHPRLWRQGVARRLMGPAVEILDGWGVQLSGLFTFPERAGHIRLYQEFGFWPRSLVTILCRAPVGGGGAATALSRRADREAALEACRALADRTFAGLDLTREIATVAELGIGETLLLEEDGAVAGFAICHTGSGSEGGSTQVYAKFALVAPGNGAAERYARLLAAVDGYALARGVNLVSLGVTTERHAAYRHLVEQGFRTQLQGVAMHRPWREAYDRPDVFAIEDWR